ncbi:MAG: NAD(P)H-dependent oxidoreductase [Chlamydiales bacterium]
MGSNPIIILGSSRSKGDTHTAVQMIVREIPVPIIDLNKLNISYYDYDNRNRNDDFISLAEQMVEHSPIILATPVYWYSMSAIMKTFIDRWSDLIGFRKDLGRRLAGKKLFLITSYGTILPKGFEDPFSQTCSYLEMLYGGCFYFYSGKDEKLIKQNEAASKNFISKIAEAIALLGDNT